MMKQVNFTQRVIVTAGSTYLDIDAYACTVAMAELLQLQGENAIAYSAAPCNYSVCASLREENQIATILAPDFPVESARYIIVDVSDPDFLKTSVPLNQVVAIYDHHVGFEEYWRNRIGDGAQIEFIGAAATLIYREWKKASLQGEMKRSTALLLIAAILDNTLNLTSANTTPEDLAAFQELCAKETIGEDWCAAYFSEVQENVEADLKNALFGDLKRVQDNTILPQRVAQLCVWDAERALKRLPEIRQWFGESAESWMINVIDIQRKCSYFVCEDGYHQKEIGKAFGVPFESGVAKLPRSYLRKEIIRKIYY